MGEGNGSPSLSPPSTVLKQEQLGKDPGGMILLSTGIHRYLEGGSAI